ncbi:MAG TPA: RelA/SpoT domain-containing protein, partial [Candidatus Obscuribacterales bacterium]
MLTLKELFEQDFHSLLSITREVAVRDESTQEMLSIPERVHFDFKRAAAFLSYLVPYSNSTLSCCAALLSRPKDAVGAATSSVDVIHKSVFSPDGIAASALKFSGEVVFYTENQMEQEEEEALFDLAKDLNYTIYLRGPSYSEMRAGLPRLIDKFMKDYERSYDYFFSAARLAADKLEETLIAQGIRAWVTFRAKRPNSLRKKIERRALSLATPKIYRTVEDIYADISDLAGVRVALYFPQDRPIVGRIIHDMFDVSYEKEMQGSSNSEGDQRFPGYRATHYRAALKRDGLSSL